MTRTARLALLVALAGAAALTAPGRASAPPRISGLFEQQLTFDSSYAQGEPSIAVNPTNPENIVLTYLANVGYGFYGAENGHPPTDPRYHEQTMQGCDSLITFDGGRTWKRQQLPVASFEQDPTRPNCSDTLVLFDKRGVAYVVGSNFQFPSFAAGQGDFRLIRSYDGGLTWTEPSVISPTVLSPGGGDVVEDSGVRFYDDREFMALDRSNGDLYVNGTQGRAGVTAQGNTEYLVVSHDAGRTWESAQAVGDASAVQLAAGFGTVLFTSPPPAGASRECSECTDVVVSSDRGRTVTRHPTMIPGKGGAIADPRRKGHFLVVAHDGKGVLNVFETVNGGLAWNRVGSLTVPGRTPSKVWLDWSPEGVVGVGWRGATSDGHYGFWGAVSKDQGRTFAVRRISTTDSPANQGVWVAGDDTSAIWLTKDRFYGTWGDWRTGSLQTFWGGFTFR